jgi:hypothetical protein
MVHPRLITGAIVAGKDWAIVVHLEFPASSGCVFMLVDVLNLIGGG